MFVKSPRTANFVGHLPVQRLAVAAAIAGAVQVGPAYALGGGLKLSQDINGGVTTASVAGARIDSKSGNLTGLTTNPFNLSFTLAANPVAPAWSNSGGDPFYSYPGSAIYTGLSSDILTGIFIQGGTIPSFLRVFRSGK